jgi:hypothetical protein
VRPEPPRLPVFIDRNSGGRLFKGLIEQAGIEVHLHDEQFRHKTECQYNQGDDARQWPDAENGSEQSCQNQIGYCTDQVQKCATDIVNNFPRRQVSRPAQTKPQSERGTYDSARRRHFDGFQQANQNLRQIVKRPGMLR